MSRSVALAAVVLVAGVASARRASAGDAECSYLEISATTGKPVIDAELKPLEKKLQEPPFSSWNEFHKLSGGELSLAKLKSETLKLAHGAATLLLRDRKDSRIELTINVDGADGKRVLDTKPSVTAGQWLVLGSNDKTDRKNGHILALTCK